MNLPLISAIIPTFNGAPFLAEAVASIRANDFSELEIIVVDDGSTDGTVELARRLGTRVIDQAHSGRPAVGRNVGIRASRSEFIAFLDQDDVWTPDKVTQQLECFETDDSLQMVWGKSQRMHLSPQGVYEPVGGPLGYWLVSAGLFRRRVFESVGFFDESMRYFGDDLDWLLRAREQNLPMKMIDGLMLHWRIHRTNASLGDLRNLDQGYDHALTEVLHYSLVRRRARQAT